MSARPRYSVTRMRQFRRLAGAAVATRHSLSSKHDRQIRLFVIARKVRRGKKNRQKRHNQQGLPRRLRGRGAGCGIRGKKTAVFFGGDGGQYGRKRYRDKTPQV